MWYVSSCTSEQRADVVHVWYILVNRVTIIELDKVWGSLCMNCSFVCAMKCML